MGKDIYEENQELRELMLQARSHKKNYFSEGQKRLIVKAHLTDRIPLTQLSEKYGVSRIAIWRWMRNFADGNDDFSKSKSFHSVKPNNPELMKVKKCAQKETPEEELVRLRAENKRLSEALQMSEWMNHAKDVMITEAEKTFNIPIRKKSGAKQ